MVNQRTILIVDDEPMVADATSRTLRAMFANEAILVTTSPEEAIQAARSQELAVVLSDLSMPVYDGSFVLKKVYEANPRTVNILVTGRATKDGLLAALNDGHLWRCMEKPWTPDQMEGVVTEALAEYDRRVEAEALAAAPPPEPAPRRGPERSGRQIVITRQNRPVMTSGSDRKVVFRRVRIGGKPSRPREVPSTIENRYRDLVLINEGGSASVYKATDCLLGMPVAIKVIAERFAKKKEAMVLLFNEARIAMQLSHKHIVRLHNVQESNGIYFLVMEYIDGQTFRTILEENGSLPPDMVIQIVNICEETLGYAHRHQVYHRDLKPDNLMLTADGVLKIIDFGVACLAIQDMRNRDEMQGTPYYISPEEIQGKDIGERADVYSLGVMIHEFLTGSLPRDGGMGDDTLSYVPLADDQLPEPIYSSLQTAMAWNAEDRWQSVGEFAASFRRAYAIAYDS